MSVDRKRMITTLSAYKDPKIMKARYGVTITPDQIRAAERAIHSYQTMTDTELRRLDEQTAMKWPYRLSDEQKYDKLMHGAGTMTIPQTILWKNIKAYLVKHPKEQKTDPECILQALQDMEGFLQLNTYLGEFEENRKLLDGADMNSLMRLFNLSYQKYLNLKS